MTSIADSVPEVEPAMRFRVAQSWWIGSELVRRHPELRLYEMHPGGGQYDVLRVFEYVPGAFPQVGRAVDMNRAGRIHVPTLEQWAPVSWMQVLAKEDPHEIIKSLEAACGWTLESRAPSTTPAAMAYRLISSILTRKLNDRHRWDARMAILDSSDGSKPSPGAGTEDFPTVAPRARAMQIDHEYELWARFWRVTVDGVPALIVCDDGSIHARTGESVELMPVYRKRNNLDDVAACAIELADVASRGTE